MACIYKINGKTFNTTEEIQNYVSSDEFVSVLAKGNLGISKEIRNLILNKDEKTTNEVREVEDGQREKGNEGKQSKGKNDGQKTNDVQNEEVTEGGVKAPQVTKGSVGVGGEVETKQQIENFGVNKADVEPVHSVISQVFDGLKKAGLTAAKTVGDWVGIGKGSEKPYSLKINGKDVQVKNVNAEVVNGFYSNTENALGQVKQEKMSGNQWATQLLSRGANKEEMQITGLEAFLKENKATSISKGDIQQFLKDNRISVVEVVKTEDGTGTNESVMNDTKFSPYQEGGEKENYKEILVTLPNQGQSLIDEYNSMVKRRKDLEKEVGLDTPTESQRNEHDRLGFKIEDLKSKLPSIVEIGNGGIAEVPTKFKSTHFEEPNILVHLRMNTRTDSNGNKVLFLEEVQSDWGQEGKKRGFEKPENTQAIEELENEKQKVLDSSKSYQLLNDKTEGNLSVKVFDAIQQVATDMIDNKYSTEESRKERFLKNVENTLSYWSKYGNAVPKMNQKELSNFYDVYIKELENNSKKISGYDTSYRLASLENKIKDINKKIYDFSAKSGTSAAPFVTDTNAWTKLGLKYALKEAVAQGADKIAWTTGEQQNDRYSLEKVADEVRYSKNDDGTYRVVAYKNGENVSEDNSLREDKLEATLGKDVAQRIIDGVGEDIEGEKSLTGENLKVGGKGMKGFYGSPTEGSLGIVGNVAKSLFKQEPKTVEIVSGEEKLTKPENIGIERNGNRWQLNFGSKPIFDTYEQAVEARGKLNKNTSTQNSIDITPELKASVEGGQPLFKDSEAQYRIENGKNIVEAIKDFNGSPKATVALTHEIMHPTVVVIIDGAKEGNEVGAKHTKTIVDEFNKANPNSKVTVEQLIEGNDAFKDGTTSKQYRAVQEFIAKSWEKYHREGGKGFSESFQKVLDQITEAFKAVYKSISGKELTPELRKMFDEILGKEAVSESKLSKPKPENVKAIEEAITKKSGTIKNEIIKEAADPTEVKKILDNLDSIKSKLAGLTTKDGDSVFSEECKWG